MIPIGDHATLVLPVSGNAGSTERSQTQALPSEDSSVGEAALEYSSVKRTDLEETEWSLSSDWEGQERLLSPAWTEG